MDENYTPSNDKSIDCEEFFSHWGVNRPFDGGLFDYRAIKGHHYRHVWAVVDDKNGELGALPGFQQEWWKRDFYIRGYVLTNRPWFSEKISAEIDGPEERETENAGPVMGQG